ncbi:radical SAM protein [Rubinisphaera margarita]|uniref:radical SAM protein n=1 Tax=Rubinisphaera margarita TaxID=2909586 RepID=UPI001EE9976D|nr:radical SAM protein [Rubinisphaera margarita]MCG6156652.1 hypothetical protein [Rubinisphaera margarita]
MIQTPENGVLVQEILTRCTGYLDQISSHSLQPYRGCSFGRSLCGVGCYVQHNFFVTRGRPWGSFLEIRRNAAEVYLRTVERERRWASRQEKKFSVFCSSSTDPFVPQERKSGITRSVLMAMMEQPPEELILQTHSADVAREGPLLAQLRERTKVRVHVSIESDRETLPSLPPPAASVERRLEACRQLTQAGIRVLVTVAPLLPIKHPEKFFERIAAVADGVIIDHFIEGDGSPTGQRTRKTPLVEAMRAVDPASVELDYRDRMVEIARQVLPGRVGVGQDGFADRLF